jgi:hypothetical protein
MAEILEFKLNKKHIEVQSYANKFDISDFLGKTRAGEEAAAYMAAFPVFGRMIRLLASHVGFELQINGASLLGTAVDSAIKSVVEIKSEILLENIQTSDELILSLVKSISEIQNYTISAECGAGEVFWNITHEPFDEWAAANSVKLYSVREKSIKVPSNEKRGLAIRIMCFGLEDSVVGRLTEML